MKLILCAVLLLPISAHGADLARPRPKATVTTPKQTMMSGDEYARYLQAITSKMRTTRRVQ